MLSLSCVSNVARLQSEVALEERPDQLEKITEEDLQKT